MTNKNNKNNKPFELPADDPVLVACRDCQVSYLRAQKAIDQLEVVAAEIERLRVFLNRKL